MIPWRALLRKPQRYFPSWLQLRLALPWMTMSNIQTQWKDLLGLYYCLMDRWVGRPARGTYPPNPRVDIPFFFIAQATDFHIAPR